MFDINDADTKKAVKELVDAAVTEGTAGLVAKNQELLGKLKKATKDALISPEDHQALQDKLTATEEKLTEAQKIAKTATKEAETAKKALEGEAKVAHNLLVENGLSAALLESGVKNPVYQKAAKAMLAGNVVLVAEGENRIAKVGDKLLKDFVSEWSKSDEGKSFVDAPNNSGGGANGGGAGGTKTKTMTRVAFEALGAHEKMAFTQEGGTLTQ
jgi:hypothetical protein